MKLVKGILECLDGNCRKRRSVQTIVESQQPIPVRRCMSTNDEIRKNSGRTWIALLTAPFRVGLKGASR